MPLEVRFRKDGSLREFWYGQYTVKGKRYCTNLGIRIAGTPPTPFSLRSTGDAVFEQSRSDAKSALKAMIAKAQDRRNSERLVEKLYEIKTGEKIRSTPLKDLPGEWERIPRRRKPNARYAAQCKSTLRRFTSFLQDQDPNLHELADITPALLRLFMDAEDARGVTAKTWNDTLKLLRATCKHLLPAGSINPCGGIPTRETETIFRKPFNQEELNAIIEAAQLDDFIYPVIVTAICTAMRRGDCCLLKWQDVDLSRQCLCVKTNKTGQTVSIPIFPMLLSVLQDRQPANEYVFPEQAAMYNKNPDGITWRVRKVFAAAGFKDGADGEDDGIRGEIHTERKEGLRRASVRDFHSFRVTWVTLALTGGIPLEIVRKVTGHKTAEIVLKHYFRPDVEDVRKALHGMMPELNGEAHLMQPRNVPVLQEAPVTYGPATTPSCLIHSTRTILEQMNSKNWRAKRDEALAILKQASGWVDTHILHEERMPIGANNQEDE